VRRPYGASHGFSEFGSPPFIRTITVNPLSKAMLWINRCLCPATSAAMRVTAADLVEPVPTHRAEFLDTRVLLFTTAAGAFVGLLGGSAAAPDKHSPPIRQLSRQTTEPSGRHW
jgi:hypothetical protein